MRLGFHRVRWRFKMGWLLAILFIAFLAFLRSRHLARLPAEAELLREPIVLLLFGLLLILFLLGLAFPRVLRRQATRLLPIGFLACIAANVALFAVSDPSTRISSFHVHPAGQWSSLGQMPGWANHWSTYALYAYLHDTLRGSTIIGYAPASPLHADFDELLHPVYLRYMAEIADYRIETYAPELTPPQVEWLLAQPHATFEDFSTKLRWTIVRTPGPAADTYRIMAGGGIQFLVRESLLQAVRAK